MWRTSFCINGLTKGQSEYFLFDQSKTSGYHEAPGVGYCVEESDDVPVSSLIRAKGTMIQSYNLSTKCMSHGFLMSWGFYKFSNLCLQKKIRASNVLKPGDK